MNRRSNDHRPGAAVRSPQSGLRNQLVICLLLALAVWVVFGQTIHHEFVNFDDDVYVYNNPTVARGLTLRGVVWAFTHHHAAFWHPLTSLSHMLDCQLYGLRPGGHHFTNVLLHAATTVLLFLVLSRMTGAIWPSAFVAGLFGIHPLHVESVAWIAERKDVLSGLFFVLTLGAYVRYVAVRNWTRYALVMLCFALGLMAKPMLVTLPFVLLLLDYWPLRRLSFGDSKNNNTGSGRVRGSHGFGHLIVEKIPLLLLLPGVAALTIYAQQQAGKIMATSDVSLPWRLANAVVSYLVYLRQMFFPFRLAAYYPHRGDALPLLEILGAAIVLTAITAAVIFWGRRFAYLPVGWFWHLGMLAPVIGLVQVGGFSHADRYTYLSQVGLYVMAAWGVTDLCRSWRYRRKVLCTTAATILAGLLIVSYAQTAYWRNSVSLWSHTLAGTAANPIAHYNLGHALVTQGKLNEAIQQFERVLQLRTDNAPAHNSLGVALATQGKWNEATPHWERALQLEPDNAQAHYNLGNALAARGKLDEAVRHLERALQLKPDYARAHNNLGNVLAAQGRWHEAIQHYDRALQFEPGYAEAENNLGHALVTHGKLDEAIRHFERALRLQPDNAQTHCNLGNAFAMRGKWNEAIRHYQQALHLATAQGNPTLEEAIRAQLDSYQTNSPRPQAP